MACSSYEVNGVSSVALSDYGHHSCLWCVIPLSSMPQRMNEQFCFVPVHELYDKVGLCFRIKLSIPYHEDGKPPPLGVADYPSLDRILASYAHEPEVYYAGISSVQHKQL